MRLVKLFSTLALLLVTVAPLLAEPDEREKVPDAKEQEKALAVVKDLFKDEFAKKKAADMLDLSEKLYKQGLETKDDQASRYVLLRESMNLGAAAGDMDQALKGAEELSKNFQVSGPELKATLYEKAVANLKTGEAGRTLAEDILQVINEAIAIDDFDTVDRLVKSGTDAAKKAKALTVVSTLTARGKDATKLREEYAKVKDALIVLEKKPTDPAANETAGKYFALAKGNWEKGLPLLAQVKDAKLKELAEKDAAGPSTAQEQMEMGDAWYEYANGLDPAYKPQTQIRALFWYEQAIGGLTGLTKTKIEKRMVDLEKVADKYRDNSEFFNALRDGIKKKAHKSSGLTGGAFVQKTFEEIPPEGALLIGFYYTTSSNGQYPAYMQPIWLTSRGEKVGQAYGKPDPKAKVQLLKAKRGYAVGGVTIRGGGGFDAFELTFMKIDKKGMKKDGMYQSEHVGGKGGGEGKYGGDGSFIVGIHGKKNDDGLMGTFGIVTLPGEKEK